MTFVLDASTAMAWCFEDETDASAERALDLLTDEQALVPPLWGYEVANVLTVAERRGRLSEADAPRFIELLHQLPIRFDSGPPDIGALVGLARRHRLSAYDASYLLLAERHGLRLATVDAALAAAAGTAGIKVLGAG